MDIEYYLLLSENPIDLAGGWGWRRVYIKNLKESGRAHPGRAHPENKKKQFRAGPPPTQNPGSGREGNFVA